MSVNDFKQATYVGLLCSRSHLTGVDQQLGKVHRIAPNDPERITQLIFLLDLCVEWSKSKQQKFDGKSKVSSNFEKRSAAINVLTGQVLADLRTALFQIAKNKGASPNAIPLAQGFGAERANYLNQKDQIYACRPPNFKSPARIDATSASYVLRGRSALRDGDLSSSKLNANTNALRAEPFANYTVDEFETLYSEFKQVFNTDLKEMGYLPRVHYVRKADRISNHMLIPIHHRLYGNASDSPYSTQQLDIYAIDRYGNLLVARDNQKKEASGTHEAADFRHSSLNAGHNVVCAGRMIIKSGEIVQMDNWSGHYQPKQESLRNAVNVLDEMSLDLSKTKIRLFGGSTLLGEAQGKLDFLRGRG